ncbi:hypothetical protein IWQ60_007178, partial [Tieghemiomyces parasiticus]
MTPTSLAAALVGLVLPLATTQDNWLRHSGCRMFEGISRRDLDANRHWFREQGPSAAFRVADFEINLDHTGSSLSEFEQAILAYRCSELFKCTQSLMISGPDPKDLPTLDRQADHLEADVKDMDPKTALNFLDRLLQASPLESTVMAHVLNDTRPKWKYSNYGFEDRLEEYVADWMEDYVWSDYDLLNATTLQSGYPLLYYVGDPARPKLAQYIIHSLRSGHYVRKLLYTDPESPDPEATGLTALKSPVKECLWYRFFDHVEAARLPNRALQILRGLAVIVAVRSHVRSIFRALQSTSPFFWEDQELKLAVCVMKELGIKPEAGVFADFGTQQQRYYANARLQPAYCEDVTPRYRNRLIWLQGPKLFLRFPYFEGPDGRRRVPIDHSQSKPLDYEEVMSALPSLSYDDQVPVGLS